MYDLDLYNHFSLYLYDYDYDNESNLLKKKNCDGGDLQLVRIIFLTASIQTLIANRLNHCDVTKTPETRQTCIFLLPFWAITLTSNHIQLNKVIWCFCGAYFYVFVAVLNVLYMHWTARFPTNKLTFSSVCGPTGKLGLQLVWQSASSGSGDTSFP